MSRRPQSTRTLRRVATAAVALAVTVGSAPAGGTRAASSAGSSSVDAAHAVALRSDGSIVAAGASSNGCERSCVTWDGFAVAGYLPNGRLDRRFGREGRALVEVGGDHSVDGPVSTAAQADGKIVVAGGSTWSWFRILRLTRAGRLDPRFGRGGLTVPFEREGCSPSARTLAIQADGKVLVAGDCLDSEAEEWHEALVARYTTDGRLDPGFGRGGSLLTAFGGFSSEAFAVVIQGDGRIVVAGEYDERGDISRLFLSRYTPDGRLDPTFGSGGTTFAAPGPGLGARPSGKLGLQPDGAIILADGDRISRFSADGHPDTSFGGDGAADPGFPVTGLAVDRDGAIVVTGVVRRGSQHDFAVRRYAPNGNPDPAFGHGGVVATDLRGRNRDDVASAVAVQRGGQVVVVGRKEPAGDDRPADFALARYTRGGRMDTRFGARGVVLTDFDAHLTGVASFTAHRQRDGAVLVRWRTTTEDDIRGYHVYRGGFYPSNRATRRIVSPRGRGGRGAAYAVRDRAATRRADLYYLQVVMRDGRIFRRGQTVVRR